MQLRKRRNLKTMRKVEQITERLEDFSMTNYEELRSSMAIDGWYIVVAFVDDYRNYNVHGRHFGSHAIAVVVTFERSVESEQEAKRAHVPVVPTAVSTQKDNDTC